MYIQPQFSITNTTNTRNLLLQYASQHFGMLWLHDAGNPIIAFAPLWLITQPHTTALNKSQCVQFSRNAITQTSIGKNNYQQTPLNQSFEQAVQAQWQSSKQDYISHNPESEVLQGFTGGLAGFVGYNTRVAALGFYDVFFKYQPTLDCWTLYGVSQSDYLPLYQHIIQFLQHQQIAVSTWYHTALTSQLQSGLQHEPVAVVIPQYPNAKITKPLTPVWSFTDYASAFNRVQQYLAAGDCYQVNLTQPFVGQINGSILALISPLFRLTQAPYSGYMSYPNKTQEDQGIKYNEILSCSPELFLTFTAEGKVITRPIKGTAPRFADAVQDASSAKALIQSQKDRSENVMIVDLLRNDLSKHAKLGSVITPVLFEVEQFNQVYHLVSQVEAELQTQHSPLALLFDALPGGSITGAPKHRAMQIIDELEVQPRQVYCGSMGYLNLDNSGRFNILIRTLERNKNDLSLWAGGGITVASQVQDEYNECLHKVGAMLNLLNDDTVFK